MRAEVIAVGTEILLGQIVDTNSAVISHGLADAGIEVYYHSLVGDNAERLAAQLHESLSRSNLVVVSGGLGPTEDDLTKQAAAAVLGVPLVEDAQAMAKIVQYFSETNEPMTENNRLQALYPQGSHPLKNTTGFAVGAFYQSQTQGDLVLLPGPPSEMAPMFTHEALPLIRAAYGQPERIESRVLRFFGIGESQLVTQLADLIDHQSNPTIAPYAKQNEVTLRLTATGDDPQGLQALLDQTEAAIDDRVGDYLYGYGDDNSLEQVVVQQLIDHRLSITAAESLTAGLFQSTLGQVPGVSAVFPGGFVTYSAQAKHSLLAIPEAIINDFGVVSAQTATWMAKQAKQKLGADIGIGFTGVAGPDELEGQPAGTVWIGLAFRNQAPEAHLYHFSKTRAAIRERSVMTGLDLVRRKILLED